LILIVVIAVVLGAIFAPMSMPTYVRMDRVTEIQIDINGNGLFDDGTIFVDAIGVGRLDDGGILLRFHPSTSPLP
jgi:hypothetical protein